ncbi:hypothetical protein OC844_001349 [Tilletia horrida]|nr:hypothetical protein OC844_001349 [Tilletia horrida]
MSQRVDKGPKFRPNVPIRRPGAAAGSSSGPSNTPASSSSSSSQRTAAFSSRRRGDDGGDAEHPDGSTVEGSAEQGDAGASSSAAKAPSRRPGAIGAPTRPPTQVTATGLKLAPRKTAIAPGGSQARAASAITPPSSGRSGAPHARITVGRPLPTPASTQENAQQERSQGSNTAAGVPAEELEEQNAEGEEAGEGEGDDEDDPEAALVRLAQQEGGDIEEGSDEAEQEDTDRKRKRKPPRAKRLTVDEEEAAYEEQVAMEGDDLAESRLPDEELSMSALAQHEVRRGKASKRTFDMMRKHEAYKVDLKNERKELAEKLIRKRQAGIDWNDKFGSDEEEAAEDAKRRSERKKRKKQQREAGDAERDGEEGEGDDDEDLGREGSPSVATVLAREVGDEDSDDGNSMTSEEGSDDEPGPSSRRQKDKGKDKRQAGASKSARGRGRGRGRKVPPVPPQESSSSDSDDSEDDVYGESQAAVQIRLGPDGKPVLSESSLTIDPSLMADVIDAGVEGVTSVIETERFINSSTRAKKTINGRWSNDETEKFYRSISQWGTDFEMIARLFPTRSRHQIKLKFSREEKQNPDRINQAFKTRIPVDLEAYGVAVGRNLSGPAPKISVKKPDDYLKMEEQERLLRAGGVEASSSAIGVRATAGTGGRRTDRAGSSSADRRRAGSSAAHHGESGGGGDGEEVILEGGSGDEGSAAASAPSASSSSMRRSTTPGAGRRRSGSHPASDAPPVRQTAPSSSRRAGFDRERDRERQKAIAEERRRERERLHRAGSGRGGGVAYESQEMVLGDADDV